MRRILAVLMLVSSIALASCDGGGNDDNGDPTSTPPVAETAESTASAPSDEIRSIDLEGAAVVADFISELGGTYEQTNVLYADVTGDGVEDAVIPLSSGGTLGNVGLIVVTPDASGDDLVEVLTVDAREFGIVASVDEGALVTIEPVPGPDDPECCPSQIRTTTYAGDGRTGLTEESSVVEPNPAGGAKTPSAE